MTGPGNGTLTDFFSLPEKEGFLGRRQQRMHLF